MTRFTRIAAVAATALTLLTAPAQALDLNAMTAAERDAFGIQVRAYLLQNPEVIIEAVNLLEQRQAQAEAAQDGAIVAANIEALHNDGFSWVGGNPDGDITLIEFMDYRCGYCRRAVPEVSRLLAEDGNIRLIIKEFPILGEASMVASRFAIATRMVAGAEAYKQVHDALMEMNGELNEVTLRRLSDGLGLDADAIVAKMQAPEITHEIAQVRDLAKRLNISGTPTFVLQDEMLRGFVPADQMSIMVANKRDQRG